MRQKFFLTLSIFFVLWACFGHAAESKEARIHKIDQQIEQLEEMKRGFESRALRQEDQASRLQFDDETYLETRRYNQLAEENRQKAAAVQKEIDRLNAEKKKLLGK